MDFIGQNTLKYKLNHLYESNSFPKVFAIIGKSGQGKSKCIEYISNLLNIDTIRSINSIDDIRDAILDAPNLAKDIILHIESFESLNFRAKETLLKLCEDVPKHVYIGIEVINSYAFEDRFYNRSYIFELAPYSKNELLDIVNTFRDNISESDLNKLLSMSGSPKDIENILNLGVDTIFNLIDKVMNNIYRAQKYNAMKICDSLSTKASENKIPMTLFFSVLKNMSFRQFLKTNNLELYNIFNCSNVYYENIINNPNVNKRALFDNFILDLHKEELH